MRTSTKLVTGPGRRRRHRGIDRICGRGNSSSSIPDMESGDALEDLVYVTVAAVLCCTAVPPTV